MNKRINAISTTLACMLSVSGSWALSAQAAEGEEQASAGVIEEMIVTAQRRSQNIQRVPNSVDAILGSEIDELNKVGMEDYINGIGGVGFTRNANGSVKVGVRGVSAVAQDEYAFASTVSTTGLYLDDVAIQGAGALPDLNLYDLQRIEVLKGPQGTLYGEGAMGGAIKMILNKPDLSEFEAKGEITGLATENADAGYRLRGAVSVPLIEDRLALRVVGSNEARKGWIDNVATGEDGINDVDSWSLRATLLAQITDAFSAETLVMYQEQDNDAFGQEVDALGDLETNLLEDEFNNVEVELYALTLKYDFGFAELSSITSYFENQRDFSQRVPFSIDEFTLPLLGFPAVGFSENETLSVFDEVETFSQELRLVSPGDQVVDWTLGAFYRDRERDVCTPYDSPAGADLNALLEASDLGFLALPATTFECERQPASGLDIIDRTASEDFEQLAFYGEASWEFVDNWRLTVGARYFEEDVEFTDDQNGYGLFSFLTVPESTNETTDSDVLFKVGLSWQATEEQLYYFNVAEGFRSGGSNLNAADTTEPERFRAFESDDLLNYELGAKTSWYDGRLTVNGALFYSDWSDIQSNILVPAVSIPTTNVLTSGGDGEIVGGELQVSFLATDNLSGGFSVTLQDAEFDDPTAESNIVEGSQLPNAPDLTASAFAQYARMLRVGEVFAHVEHRFVDDQRTVVEPVVPVAPGYDDDLTILDSYHVTNLTLGLRTESWYVTGFVQNLFDERYALDYGTSLSFFLGGFNPNMTAVGTPRTVGLTLGTSL